MQNEKYRPNGGISKLFSTIEDLPIELVEPMKALTSETRRKIFLSLFENYSISYSQIQNGFEIKKGTLNHHLHILVSSGLIRNFSIESPGNPYKSYYAITNFGYRFIEGLGQTLEPRREQQFEELEGASRSSRLLADSTLGREEELQQIVIRVRR
jgi:DNA-binding HxlR family transcriptional regulator